MSWFSSTSIYCMFFLCSPLSGGAPLTQILHHLQTLFTDQQWRIRLAVLKQVPDLAQECGTKRGRGTQTSNQKILFPVGPKTDRGFFTGCKRWDYYEIDVFEGT